MSITALQRTLATATLLAAASLISPLASAGQVEGSAAQAGAYLGAGFGGSRLDYDVNTAGSLNIQGAEIDRSGIALKVFGGYQFNPNFAIEGHVGYQPGYEVRPSAGAGDKQDLTTVGVAGIVSIPIAEVTSLFAKLGFAYWDGLDFDNSNPSPRPEPDGEDIFYGLGFEIIGSWRFEWEHYKHDEFNSDVFSISYVYRFPAR